jgi:tRNA(fMet)-specific endonuclease VapC
MLLDTNIVGYFFRNDTRARLYERHLTGQQRFISFATVAELYQWTLLRTFSPANKKRLLEHIDTHVVISFDDQLAWTWARIKAASVQTGKSISPNDAWIAATAIRHNLPLITHNRRHFEGISGLLLISEA